MHAWKWIVCVCMHVCVCVWMRPCVHTCTSIYAIGRWHLVLPVFRSQITLSAILLNSIVATRDHVTPFLVSMNHVYITCAVPYNV